MDFYTKTSTEREVAHLYEHIFLIELNNYLISKGCLPYLDYILGGESMRGEIEINFRSFNVSLSEQREEILNEVDKGLRFTSEKIKKALDQISAEKSEDVVFLNPDIVEKMRAVRQRKWREGATIDIDLNSGDSESEFIHYANNPDLRFYTIPIEVSYKGKDVELGLFLCRVIMESFCEMLCNEFSCSFDGASDEMDRNYVSLASMLLKPDKAVIRKEMLEKRAEEYLKNIKKTKNVMKLRTQLKKGPYIDIGIDSINGRKIIDFDNWSKFADLLKIKSALDKVKIRPLEITTE